MRKDIAKSILAQTVATMYGVREYQSSSLMNFVITDSDGSEKNMEPPANLRLRITNEPVMEYREAGHGNDRKRVPIKPCILNPDELVRLQLGLERKELGGSRRSKLDPSDLKQLEYLESLRVLEYAASLEVAYGRDDFITAEEALDAPELNYIGPELERLIKSGLMDVLIANAKRKDHNGEAKPANVNRPHTFTINMWDLRRILAKNTVPASIPERLGGPGSKFFLLTGTSTQSLGRLSGVFPEHVIVGRMPDENARPRRMDFRSGGKLGQGKRGQPRRGWLMALTIENVVHADATYQGYLVPMSPGEETLHMRWLRDHPTPDDHDVIMFLNEAIADAEEEEATAPPAEKPADGEPDKVDAEPAAEPKPAEAEASPAEEQGEAQAEPDKTKGAAEASEAEPAAEGSAVAAPDQPRETMPVGDDELIPKEAEASPAEAQGEAQAEPAATPIPAPVVQSQPDIADILNN